jgi:hypothetical protein
MLVWLASYPRSGNTLLRQVLKTCFDLDSCEGLEPIPEHVCSAGDVTYQHYGAYALDGDREEFYRQARQSAEPVLVKTHLLPHDDSKAIYVVRDGRLAIKSFVEYQKNYDPANAAFAQLLVGDHPYSEWTSHYRAWTSRPAGPLLVLRFEELVNPGPETLARIGEFVGVGAPVRSWVSRLGELREHFPASFGTGAPAWKSDAFWTESRLRQFYTLHGELLAELGYTSTEEVRAGALPSGSDEEQLLRAAHRLAAHRNALQAVCDERSAVIERLSGTCAERLAEIQKLAGVCEARGRVIHELESARGSLQGRLNESDRSLREAQDELRPLRRYTLLGLLSRLIPR